MDSSINQQENPMSNLYLGELEQAAREEEEDSQCFSSSDLDEISAKQDAQLEREFYQMPPLGDLNALSMLVVADDEVESECSIESRSSLRGKKNNKKSNKLSDSSQKLDSLVEEKLYGGLSVSAGILEQLPKRGIFSASTRRTFGPSSSPNSGSGKRGNSAKKRRFEEISTSHSSSDNEDSVNDSSYDDSDGPRRGGSGSGSKRQKIREQNEFSMMRLQRLLKKRRTTERVKEIVVACDEEQERSKALAALAKGNLATAFTHVANALVKNPDRLDLAEKFLAHCQKEGLSSREFQCEEDDDDWRMMYFRAYLVAKEGNMREALALLLGAVSLEPASTALTWALANFPSDEINTGIDQISMEFVSLAIHSYLEKKNSGSESSSDNCDKARELAGLALADFVGRVWQLRKKDSCTHVLYSYLLLLRTLNKHSSALKLLLDLWEYPTSSVPMWRVCVGVGEILADCGNYREAIVWFKRAQSSNPTTNYFLFELGVAYNIEERYHDAAKCFDEFCKANPRTTLARLARSHLEDVRLHLGPMIPFYNDNDEGSKKRTSKPSSSESCTFFIAYQNQGFKEVRNFDISEDKSKFEHMLRLKAATAWDLPLKLMRRFEFFNLDTKKSFGSIAQLLGESRAGEFYRLGVRLPGESVDFTGIDYADLSIAPTSATGAASGNNSAATADVEVEVCL